MTEKTNEITERILTLAKEKQLDLSEAQAEIYAKRLDVSTGELADDELDNVSGGSCAGEPKESEKGLTCPSCGGSLSWDYDESWTTARCKKCKKFYLYAPYGLTEVNLD